MNDNLIEDFDKEVNERSNLILKNMENFKDNMLNSLELTLLSIPENIRKMSMKILIEKYEGNIQKAVLELNKINSIKNKIKKTPSTPTKNQIPLNQNLSLSDLLNKKANNQTPIKKTPQKSKLPPKPPIQNSRTPTRAQTSRL